MTTARQALRIVDLLRTIAWALLLLALAVLVTACGGGGPDEPAPDVPLPAVDCKADPKVCA